MMLYSIIRFVSIIVIIHSLFSSLPPQTNALFEKELSKMNVTKPFSRFVHTTYDAVWSIALALKSAEQLWRNESRVVGEKKKLKRLNSFDYNRSDLAEDFVKQFGMLKFKGISVMLSF